MFQIVILPYLLFLRYIQEDILKPDDPYFRTFFRVFETFRIQEPEVKKHEVPPNVSDLVAKAALESKRLAAQRQDDSDDEEEEGDKEQPKISKKKLRRMNRLSVAQLKQLVERPDVVEMHDVTAPDPKLLIHLKVMCPSHYCCDWLHFLLFIFSIPSPLVTRSLFHATGVSRGSTSRAREALRSHRLTCLISSRLVSIVRYCRSEI